MQKLDEVRSVKQLGLTMDRPAAYLQALGRLYSRFSLGVAMSGSECSPIVSTGWLAGILLMLAACAGSSASISPSGAPLSLVSEALIEFRLAHSEPADGRIPVKFDGSVLYIERDVIASDNDFLVVRPSVYDGDLVLWVELSPEASARVARITGANIGRRIALIFNSQLVNAAVIRSAGGGAGPVQVQVPIVDPKQGAELVYIRWPEATYPPGVDTRHH